MSLAVAISRVSELEAALNSAAGVPPPAPTGPVDFHSQLTAASLRGALGGGSPLGDPAQGAGAAAGGAGASLAEGAAGGSAGGVSGPYAAQINASAARHHLDPALLKALIRQESDFDPHAGSAAGARGLTQLMPGTAAALGVRDPLDPAQAIEGGAKYLRQQLDTFGGDVRKALAAYNAGPGAVQRYGGVPPYAETQNYVRRILSYAGEYRHAGGPSFSRA